MTSFRRQGSRPSPWKRKARRAKWLSGEALQTAEKRREAKDKGEKQRYARLNAEFQRLARLPQGSMQRNRGKQQNGRDWNLFKKIRDTKGTFHAKVGLIKDKNGMDLRETEDIEKRWQEYTEELYKKDVYDSP